MFGLISPDMLVIFVLALILFGPEQMTDLARQLGKGLRHLRKATEEMRSHFKLDD